jgi:hypothetical protein
LKEDTIPKPDGLAMVMQSTEVERNSDNIEQCSKMIEDCSHSVRESMLPAGRASDGSICNMTVIFRCARRAHQIIDSERERRSKAPAPSRL